MYNMGSKYLFIVTMVMWICHVRGDDYLLLYGDMREKDASDPVGIAYSYSSPFLNEVTIRGPGSQSEDRNVKENTVLVETLSKSIVPVDGKELLKTVLLSSKGRLNTHAHMFTPKQGQGTLMAVNDLGGEGERQFVVASANPRTNYESQISVATRQASTVTIYDSDRKQVSRQSLEARQTYTYKSGKDLTGYRVTTDKAAAVTSGTTCSDLSSHDPPQCDPIRGYIPSVDRLGKLHIVPQIGSRKSSSDPLLIRVVAQEDGTAVKLYSKGTDAVKNQYTLTSGKYKEIEVTDDDATFVECSKPCLVFMLMKPFIPKSPYPGSPGVPVSGPLMILVPQIWKASLDMTFHVPYLEDALLYSLTIVTPKDTRDSLRLNGNPITVSWQDIGGMPTNTSGTFALNSKAGDYRLTSEKNDVPFLVYLFIHGPLSSFGGALNSYHSGGIPGMVTPTTTEKAITSTDPSDRPSFTLQKEDPNAPSTPSTTVTTTRDPDLTTPTEKPPTGLPTIPTNDIDYEDNPDQPIYTRRPIVSTTTAPDLTKKAASWKVAVIVVVFLAAIAAVVVGGYFLIQRSRAARKDKSNEYMGQARAEFTPEGMVDSRVTMGEPQPYIDPNKGKHTFRGRLKDLREVVVSGLDTVRFPRRTTEA